MVFVDGENLLLRYEAMLAEGRNPRVTLQPEYQAFSVTQHSKGRYVWNASIPREIEGGPLVRVTYYTTATGDSNALEELETEIATLTSDVLIGSYGNNRKRTYNATNLVPKVFKKQKSGTKTKSVDINLCVDVLRQAYQAEIDDIFIVSGDGDYAPLILQAMSTGKRVHVAALSSGLSPIMRRISDRFLLLDYLMFEEQAIT